MINLKCRTEYSFRTAYGRIEQILERGGVGVCDRNGTWGHVQFAKAAKGKGIKPVFGVELACVEDATLREKQPANWMSFLAKNNRGMRELYELVTLATSQTYYIPRIDYSNLHELSEDLFVFSGALPKFGLLPRKNNFYVELSPVSSPQLLKFAQEKGYKVVACSDNYYPSPEMREVYEVIASDNRDSRTTAMHLLEEWEWREALPWAPEEALKNAEEIYNSCDAELPTAKMVKFESSKSLKELCLEGASTRKTDLSNELYKSRLERELELIKQKDFEDYFYVIADMVNYAKKHMLVGPARGSSCGSLVCYLLGITDIDPLPYDLLFERFIDINREDLPDIDIDFQDDRREMVFDYLRQKYGSDKVARLGTVMRYKAKSAIDDVARELHIPSWEVKDLKGAIIERSSGDSRAQFCIADTFETLEVGRTTLEKHPQLYLASYMEGHARQSGQHAAGVLVTAEPIANYCSVDKKTGCVMVDKKDAEDLNLLKIDALGLTTLSVIQDVLDAVGWSREKLLSHPLDDEKAFEVLNSGKFCSIFQFDGFALQSVCRQMPVKRFEDIAAITALARPGPLTSGGTAEYIKRHNGIKETVYVHEEVRKYTEETHGIVVYQEQVMQLVRNLGKLTWEDTSTLRKAMSKSFGKEYFDKFKERFVKGAIENGLPEEPAGKIWDELCTFGAWGFNKCISGDTKVRLAYSNRELNECTIADLYEKYVENPSPWIKQRKSMPWLVSFDGTSGKPQVAKAIHKSGRKECWRYSFDDGSEVECTKDHKFIIEGSWRPAKEAEIGDNFVFMKKITTPYKKKGISSKGKKYGRIQEGFPEAENNPSYANGKTRAMDEFIKENKNKNCQDCSKKHRRMEAHHNDFNEGRDRPEDLAWLCPSCHKKRHYANNRAKLWSRGYVPTIRKLTKIESVGEKETYDIEMPDIHNFALANGLVTHNSHAISYGLLSYWCCVLKAYFPLEFAAANLRHSKKEEQVVKLIREIVAEGYKYKVFDPELSKKNWSASGDTLIGGLLNIVGIGDKMADDIIKRKELGIELTNRQKMLLEFGKTPYDNIFEARERFGHLYKTLVNAKTKEKPVQIAEISDSQDYNYLFIGKLVSKNIRDLNEVINVQKRGGKVFEEHTKELLVTFSDDSGQIRAKVGRFNYDRIGKPMVENAKIGDWFAVRGSIRKGFLSINIETIKKL